MEQSENNVTETTTIVEQQVPETPVVENPVPETQPVVEQSPVQEPISVQTPPPVQSMPEFVCTEAARPVDPVIQPVKKESFLSKHKGLIGGVTAGALTIAVLAAVFVPKLLNMSIPDPNAGKNINAVSNQDKLISVLKLESGSKLPKYTMFFNDSNIETEYEINYFLNDQQVTIDDISEIEKDVRYLKGTNVYKIELVSDNETLTTSLEVVDTQKPAVVLKTINVNYGEEYNPKDFVNQYDDNSREYAFTVNLKDEKQKSFKQSGQHSVLIEVCDKSNNCTDQRATIVVGDKSIALTGTKEQKITVKTEEIKYGVKKITYVNVIYNMFKDGSTEELRRGSEEITVDQSGFNGTAKTMKDEMLSNFNSYASARTTILNKTNEYRKEKGIGTLKLDDNLSKVATLRAMEIAYSGQLSHTRPNGQDWTTMWEEYNDKERDIVMAENIAGEFNTDVEVVTEWHNSRAHNAIMLESRFTKIGIGKYSFNGKTYWVQHFAE